MRKEASIFNLEIFRLVETKFFFDEQKFKVEREDEIFIQFCIRRLSVVCNMKVFWKHSIIYTWTQFFSFSELVRINYFYTMLKHWNFNTIFFHDYAH